MSPLLARNLAKSCGDCIIRACLDAVRALTYVPAIKIQTLSH